MWHTEGCSLAEPSCSQTTDILMTGWAMLIVEIIHPYVLELHEIFIDCEQCTRATSTVMQANLLLFKTVIAGDSWGQIAVPVIESHPETSIIFVGSLLTLVFGVLNLIVAAENSVLPVYGFSPQCRGVAYSGLLHVPSPMAR